jgi:hypothetical protein
MWMPLLTGEHVSTDAAVINGEPMWWQHTIGKVLGQGMFDHWVILRESRPEIERYCGDWLRRNLQGYTGCVNFETIGGKIIEAHLRFADQWPDLYSPGWIEAVVDLYANGHWHFGDEARRTGYSVVLYGEHGRHYKKLERQVVNEFLHRPGISSIQITFHDDRPPEMHSMPPGGFRLAIVNSWDAETGFDVREELAAIFRSPQLLPAHPNQTEDQL